MINSGTDRVKGREEVQMNRTGKVMAVCTGRHKGAQKEEVPEIKLVRDWGIRGDAHGGKWHRQVSLLSDEKIAEFKARGATVNNGDFGENIIIKGFDLKNLPVGTRFQIGDALLELTQVGKDCHSHCVIYYQMGDCIMPREGVFTKVLEGGTIKAGDEVVLIEADPARPYTAAWITLSDKGAMNEREDKSGPLIGATLEKVGYAVEEGLVIPDEPELLKSQIIRLADQRQVDVIITTGGTGFAARDMTPEATTEVCDRMAPGIAEALRSYSMTKTPRAMLSRGVAGIRGKTLIINLPGSPKAVEECMEILLTSLDHGLSVLLGRSADCARK